MRVKFFHQIIPFLNSCYRHKYIQHIRAVYKGCHNCIQGDNNNNAKLKFQAEQTERLEAHGLNITGIKQAQTTNIIVEGIYRRVANKSVNFMKGHISN